MKIIATILGIVLTWFVSSPANAADEISYSNDGQHFSSSLAHPLFASSIRWVPGDSRTATFYVRNNGGSSALLTIDVLGERADGLLSSGDLVVALTVRGRTETAAGGARHRLVRLPHVRDGQVVPVTVDVTLVRSAPNDTQLLSSQLDFAIGLTQEAGSVADDSDDSDALLPNTGAPASAWLILVALAAVCGGITIISRRPIQQRND